MNLPVKAFKLLFIIALLAAGAGAQPSSLQPDSRRECAVCHLEWVDAFNNPEAPLLIDKPSKPTVADEESCLGCHDGSVEDSRRRVWAEHGHKTNISPPSTMSVPKELPLDAGKIVCRTCHTAHSSSEQGNLSKVFFLREDDGASRLCRLCHAEKARGPELGSHPIGGMSWPIPQSLIEAGAKASPGQRQIFCQVCHTAHGSKEERLLVMGVSDNRLCLTCHGKLRPGMWRPMREGVHPDRPIVRSPEKLDAIKKMHTRLGPENRLICLSCHKLHEGRSGRFLLAMPLKDSTFCIQCHSEKKGLTSTVHDLRKSAPKAENRLGLTVEQAGPCSSCHMFHNLALRPIPTETDPLGVCSRCHKTGGMAGRLGDMKMTHPVHPKNGPEIACQKCHDPHNNVHPDFLKETSSELCRACHAKNAEGLAGGPHDAATWTSGFGQDNKCFACHQVHSWDEKKKLWTFVPAPVAPPSDGACMGCHKNVRWPTSQPWQVKDVLHPRQNDMKCKSCHDPHMGGGTVELLRGSTLAHPAAVCLECHKDVSFINQSMHSPRAMGLEGHDKNAVCGPCHAVHAVEGSRREKLWAVGSGADTKDRCLACHGPGGTATMKPIIVRHPEEPLKSLSMAPITCLTCHLPHGKKTDLPDNVSLTILAASKPMLRSGVAETICATCHTMEASTRFLYYHFPEKRKK